MCRFTKKQREKILSAEVAREQVVLSKEERDALLKAIYEALGTKGLFLGERVFMGSFKVFGCKSTER